MKNVKYVHCPRLGCDKPLPGSWDDYLTGEVHPKTGLPVYQCPNCHFKFTADSFRANAIPVTRDKKDIVLFDTVSKKIIDIIPHTMKFTDGKFYYVHIPINMCITNTIRCFSFETKGKTVNEIVSLCEQAIKDNIEVLR